jgi:hypothetical protein
MLDRIGEFKIMLTFACLNCFALQSTEKIAAASTSNSSGVEFTDNALVSKQPATVSNTAAQPSMASALFNVPANADCVAPFQC